MREERVEAARRSRSLYLLVSLCLLAALLLGLLCGRRARKAAPCDPSPLPPPPDQSSSSLPAGRPRLQVWRPADGTASILARDGFGSLHHASPAAPGESLLSDFAAPGGSDPYDACAQVYLLRTGVVRFGRPNKCAAVGRIALRSSSPFALSLRAGESARLRDCYQNDYGRRFLRKGKAEARLVGGLLDSLDLAVEELRAVVSSQGSTSQGSLVVMVANDGVLDFVLNFACSLRRGNLSSRVLVFVQSPKSAEIVRAMGLLALFVPGLGSMPASAAGEYGDVAFAEMMWLKVSSVFLAHFAGFDVLFQDADMVWYRDPLPLLEADPTDVLFMDDGARTTRFTPYFVNSGFYFLRRNPRTQQLMERMLRSAEELGVTHSHQSTLTRYLTETQQLANLQIGVLDADLFPSGQRYHDNKAFLRRVKEGAVRPFVFHMSFTATSDDKRKYFRDIDMWLLNQEPKCLSAVGMDELISENSQSNLLEMCCAA